MDFIKKHYEKIMLAVALVALRETHAQGAHGRARNLVLDGEHVGQLAVPALRPDVVAVGHVDELADDQPQP